VDLGFGVLLLAGAGAAVLPEDLVLDDLVGAVLLILLGLLLSDFVIGVLPVIGFFSAVLTGCGGVFCAPFATCAGFALCAGFATAGLAVCAVFAPGFTGVDFGAAAFCFAGAGLPFDCADAAVELAGLAGFTAGATFFTGFFRAGLGAGFLDFTAALAVVFFAISGSLHSLDHV
jgi:hypothetical protein